MPALAVLRSPTADLSPKIQLGRSRNNRVRQGAPVGWPGQPLRGSLWSLREVSACMVGLHRTFGMEATVATGLSSAIGIHFCF